MKNIDFPPYHFIFIKNKYNNALKKYYCKKNVVYFMVKEKQTTKKELL